MDQPFEEGDLQALAHACEERAWELQARAWQTQAERNALRAATAKLLTAVSRRLAAQDGSLAGRLDTDGVRAILATQVAHSPLQSAQDHAWITAFEPGAERADAPAPTDASVDPSPTP